MRLIIDVKSGMHTCMRVAVRQEREPMEASTSDSPILHRPKRNAKELSMQSILLSPERSIEKNVVSALIAEYTTRWILCGHP